MPPLDAGAADLTVHKGEAVDGAGYSEFENTGLGDQLDALGVDQVGVCGVTTEYCVRATAIDAAKAGFRVAVLTDLIRPVQAAAVENTLREMSALGIDAIDSKHWL